MNARYLLRLLLLTCFLLALGPVYGVRADAAPDYVSTWRTVLSVEPAKPFTVGEQPSITVHLKTVTGIPLEKRTIWLFNYRNQWQNRIAQGVTDATGTARIPITFYFRPGSYSFLASFAGSEADRLDPSYNYADLMIIPATLQVQTVPPLPGVQFSLDGQTQTTDANGLVKFSVDHVGGYHIQALPRAQDPNSDVKITFYRWENDVSSPGRDFQFEANRVMQAAFLINYRVNLKYTDQANQIVDPARISQTRVRNAGSSYTLSGPAPVWLPSNYFLHPTGGPLQSVAAVYDLEAVTFGGVNVVNPGQQRFQMSPGATWWMSVLLYPARFTAHDALLRSRIGSGIVLEYPSGAQQKLSFDPTSGAIRLDALPRGVYHASVEGAEGLQPRIPLEVSRNQAFDLIVVSRVDMAILLGGPALAVLLLLVIRRIIAFLWLTLRRRPDPHLVGAGRSE